MSFFNPQHQIFNNVTNSTNILKDVNVSIFFFIWEFFYIIFMIIGLFFVKRQPLKSRGFLPFLVCALVIVRSTTDLALILAPFNLIRPFPTKEERITLKEMQQTKK